MQSIFVNASRTRSHHVNRHSYENLLKTKSIDNHQIINAFLPVGVTGFEPATTRPPDVYSNRAELHPENVRVQMYASFVK